MDLWMLIGSLRLLEEGIFKLGVNLWMTGEDVVKSALFSANFMLIDAV
jgi:hypothetical protein